MDSVEPRARIAVYQYFSTHTDEFPPFYALWGRHFEHRVYALPKLSRTATLAWLKEHSIGYVYVRRADPAGHLAARRSALPDAVLRRAGRGVRYGASRTGSVLSWLTNGDSTIAGVPSISIAG